MLKKTLDPYRAVPIATPEEPVESVACFGSFLYVGTSAGNLLRYDVVWPGGSRSEDGATPPARRSAAVRLSSRRPVEQVCASNGLLFALCDGALTVFPADLQSGNGVVLCRDARSFCLRTGLGEEESGTPEVCVSLRKKLALFVRSGRAFEQRQEFPIQEAALALAWHQSWIIAGFRREYSLYSDTAGVPRDICHIDGKFPPQIAVASQSELLLMVQENVGIFFNVGTQQPSMKKSLTWPRKIARLGAAGSYIFGSTGTGQIDIFSVRDQKNCQTMALDGTTVGICTVGGGKVVMASSGSLVCLDPVPFSRQVQKLLMQARVGDALDLLNASFGPEDPRREEQLSLFHIQAGWALFRDLQFKTALQHFTLSQDFNIVRVLVFWRRYLPDSWEPPPPGDDYKGRTTSGAPDPRDINEFIQERLHEKDGVTPSPAMIAASVSSAHVAMVSFLEKQRGAVMQAQERAGSKSSDRCEKGGTCSLLRAVDTALLKLLVEAEETDERIDAILDSGCSCQVEDCEVFLRERERLDVLARFWKSQGLYEKVLEQWSLFLRVGGVGASGTEASTKVTCAKAAAELADALTSAAPCPGGAALLRKYVPQLLAAAPASVLTVFVGSSRHGRAGVCPLSTDEVLNMLSGHDDLAQSFLEYAMQKRKDVEPHHRTRLGMLYTASIETEQKNSSDTRLKVSAPRQGFLKFLEGAPDLDVAALLPPVEKLGLTEEQVVLRCREGRHKEALRLLVEVLNNLPRAEVYCRILGARRQRKALLGSSALHGDALSVFCAEVPPWAQPIAFNTKRSQASASANEADLLGSTKMNQSDGMEPLGFNSASGIPGAGSGAGKEPVRPLMMLLQVLLEAYENSGKDPTRFKKVSAEYKDAVLILLMAYAGHWELPPHEVVNELPAGWALESLAPYLTKCARICLHDKRATMLEENLSSMAYLKTFSAWAQERMRKVNITGDKCCPVCNRRFVDKDSVGKAFVAYPSETCVHLQCKEDLSVCPKTGRNFANNLSVYCHALGTELCDGLS